MWGLGNKAIQLFLLKASFQCQFTSGPVRVNWSITFTNHSAENTAVWGPANCIPPTKEMPPSSCHTSQLLAPEWLQSSRTLQDKQSCHKLMWQQHETSSKTSLCPFLHGSLPGNAARGDQVCLSCNERIESRAKQSCPVQKRWTLKHANDTNYTKAL